MQSKKIIWIDFKNSHEPLFFKSIIKSLPNYEKVYTHRDHLEVSGLIKKYGYNSLEVGGRTTGSMLRRKVSFMFRVLKLLITVPKYDISLHHGSIWASFVSKIQNRKSICLTDNEKDHDLNKWTFKFSDYLLTPSSIPIEELTVDNISKDKVLQFDGYKEQIYINDYKPDKNFIKKIPFDDYVVIRPEAMDATYVKKGKSLVRELVNIFSENGFNIVFLPRNNSYSHLIKKDNIFIPPKPMNGLDLCYHSKAVLTGSGTLAREAACLGIPAVSFYPSSLLAVDKSMISKGWVFHSRQIAKMYHYVLNSKKNTNRIKDSLTSQSIFLNLLKTNLKKLEKNV